MNNQLKPSPNQQGTGNTEFEFQHLSDWALLNRAGLENVAAEAIATP